VKGGCLHRPQTHFCPKDPLHVENKCEVRCPQVDEDFEARLALPREKDRK